MKHDDHRGICYTSASSNKRDDLYVQTTGLDGISVQFGMLYPSGFSTMTLDPKAVEQSSAGFACDPNVRKV